jgi:hypothetical protein
MELSKMSRTEKDQERENRIEMEVIVDAYDKEEVVMGWYYYLSENINFPFEAQWISGKKPEGRTVQVVGMSDCDDCLNDMFVQVEYEDDEFSARLSDISPLNVDQDTQQAIADWHYWIARGYEL